MGRSNKGCHRCDGHFPAEVFWEVRRLGIGFRGQRILNLGSAANPLAHGFASAGALVLSADGSDPPPQGDAAPSNVPGPQDNIALPEHSVDVVAAAQCRHWYSSEHAMHEAWRVLRPGGTVMIAQFDWLTLRGSVPRASERLMLEFNPSWRLERNDTGHVHWLADIREARFVDVRSFSFDVDLLCSHAAWRKRIAASAGIADSLPADQLLAFDAAHGEMLAATFPQNPMLIPHRVWVAIGWKGYASQRNSKEPMNRAHADGDRSAVAI